MPTLTTCPVGLLTAGCGEGQRGGPQRPHPLAFDPTTAHRVSLLHPKSLPPETPLLFVLLLPLSFSLLSCSLLIWCCSWSPSVHPSQGHGLPWVFWKMVIPILLDVKRTARQPESPEPSAATAVWGPSSPRFGERALVMGADGTIWAGPETCRRWCEVTTASWALPEHGRRTGPRPRSEPDACCTSLRLSLRGEARAVQGWDVGRRCVSAT